MDWSTLHLLLLLIIIHHCSSLCYTSHIVLYITLNWKNTVLTHGEVELIKKKKKKYHAGYQPEGRAYRAARRLIPSLIQGIILDRVPP